MHKTIAFTILLALFLAAPAGAAKKAPKNSVSFDPNTYSCASFLKMIGSSAKSGEEEAGVAVMWGFGFLSGLEFARSMENPSALDDKTLAALVLEYAAVCKRHPAFTFFEATARLAGVSEKPAPPSEPDNRANPNNPDGPDGPGKKTAPPNRDIPDTI
ncbi:MAG: hypothetical protein HQK81_03955 [Desulfovibrionaceae bacterium]|nr:hypothetical protein [Desulfovibrionaceae bacterium]MBF0513198.1 hypothetical protein [Desulfovibrionaceae bacterium]